MKSLWKVSLLGFLVTVVSCSSGEPKKPKQDPNRFITNTQFPGAQGSMNTKIDKNGNTNLEIRVKHLAAADMISPGANAYVVWVQPSGTAVAQNIGTLKVNENLEGSHMTKVPYKNFRVFITPESNTMAQRPTGVTVLEKTVNL